jgi:hypothetical protein
MEWLCNCGKEATRIEILWQWRSAESIGHKRGRFVSYRCEIGCDHCVREHGEENCQYFEVGLNGRTKSAVASQIVPQILRQAPRGYVPKTDLKKALRDVHKAGPPQTVQAEKIQPSL